MQIDDKSKKRKLDDLTSGGAASTATTNSQEAASKKAKTNAVLGHSTVSASYAADTYIQAKSVWSGVAEQPGFDPCPLMFALSLSRVFNLSLRTIWSGSLWQQGMETIYLGQ